MKIKNYGNNRAYIAILIPLIIIISQISCQNLLSQTAFEIDEVKFIHKDTRYFEDGPLNDAAGITKVKTFKQNILDEDIGKLKKFYFDNGFFDVKVDTGVQYNFEDESVIIRFIITEGKHYRIDSLQYRGLDKLPEGMRKQITKIKTIKSRDYYNKVLILQQTNEILDLLQNNGYMNARVRSDSGTIVKKYHSAANSSASVIIHFEGADTVFKFGKTGIKIEHNIYGVSEDVLRKGIVYSEGDIYSKEKKLESERNISQVAIIQSARVEATSTNNNTVDFTVTCKLNKKHEIIPYVEGTNIDNIFYVGGGVRYLNKYFLGGGKVLSLEAHGLLHSAHVNRVEFVASITQPNIFNNKTSLTDKITAGMYNLEGFKNYYAGNLTTLNYYLAEYTFYNNFSVDLTEEVVWFKFDIDSSGTLTLFNSLLSGTIVHDNTNDAVSPSRGFYHSITLGHSGLIPSLIIRLFNERVRYSQYYKIFTSNRFYFNISSMLPYSVFATNLKVGDIIEHGKNLRTLPVQAIYRFFSGGSNSLRGWNAKRNGILENTLNGGEFLLEGSFELRKKLFPKSESFTKNISGAFFLDWGNVWETHKDFRFNQIALAIGIGARYNLFLGPIRVDLGFKLYDPVDKQNEKWLFSNISRIFKDKWAINFGIGEAF